ncbi:MAG: hypothetical protein MJZ90_08255 [Bacteroidales bacterium]|nr:hypothetical protein [Bacteroidales bacterium]
MIEKSTKNIVITPSAQQTYRRGMPRLYNLRRVSTTFSFRRGFFIQTGHAPSLQPDNDGLTTIYNQNLGLHSLGATDVQTGHAPSLQPAARLYNLFFETGIFL